MDISFTFTTGFMGDPADAGLSGTAYEILPTPVDEAIAYVLAPFRFWPVPHVVHLSKRKIGYRPGCNVAVVDFEFDRPVTAWMVRANSRSHLDGTEVQEWHVRVPGFGQQPFGDAPFGGTYIIGFGEMPFGSGPFGGAISMSAVAGTATIYDDDLLQGENEVAIYGRGLDGTWTPPVGVAA
jgi:hypothetical protein